jgi:hypothetical protein
MCQNNPVTKHPHFAEHAAGHHKWVQKSCNKTSTFHFRKGWTWCHWAFWGGCTLCHMWRTVHLEVGVDEKYLDGSDRWQNVTGVNCHSRLFVGWTDSVGQIVTRSVRRWTDRQGTKNTPSFQLHICIFCLICCSPWIFTLLSNQCNYILLFFMNWILKS